MRRSIAGLVLAVVVAGPACSQGLIDDAAQAAIDRSRETHATYSVFTWNRVSFPDANPFEEWSAEFHDGDLHRVETPRDRLIANCASQTGTHYNAVTGERVSGPSIARAACGVQANSRILSATFDGRKAGPFGVVEKITIRDPENVRTYEIMADGALVGATIELEDGTVLLDARAVAVETTVPRDIFSEESLERSAVPERYRKPPANEVSLKTTARHERAL